jgi:nitric oxide reductase large subunit
VGKPSLVSATAVGAEVRWPIYFFISVAFWNLVGAGLFGFMINPPITLYDNAIHNRLKLMATLRLTHDTAL